MKLTNLYEGASTVLSSAVLVASKIPSVVDGIKLLYGTDPEEALSIGTFLERNALSYPDIPAILYENRCITHLEFNRAINQYAHYLISKGIKKGDAVAVYIDNRPELLFCVGALCKIGAIAAMIAAGDARIAEIAVIADAPRPVSPCGGCRQKIAEFAAPETPVLLATTGGETLRTTVGELLPGAFDNSDMSRVQP